MVRRTINGHVVCYCDYTGMIITGSPAFFPKFNEHGKLIKTGQYMNWEVVMRVAFELCDEHALAYLIDHVDPCLYKAPSYEKLNYFGGELTCAEYIKVCEQSPSYNLGLISVQRDVPWVHISPNADENVTIVRSVDMDHSMFNRHDKVKTSDAHSDYMVHYSDGPLGEGKLAKINQIAKRLVGVEAYGPVCVTRWRKLGENDVRDVGLKVTEFLDEKKRKSSKRKAAEPKSMSKEEFDVEKESLVEAFNAFEMNLARTAERPRALPGQTRDRSGPNKKPKRPAAKRSDDAA